MSILTLVSPNTIPDFDLSIKKSYHFLNIQSREVLKIGKAARWHLQSPLNTSQINQIRNDHKIDIFQTDGIPNIQLFLADMDSTIVVGETLDDMAALAGIGDKVAKITARAMRGELDFEQALSERVALLKGQSTSLIDRALDNIEITPGAGELLYHLKSRGVYCVLISGGFTQFTSIVAKDLKFDAHFGNELVIDKGHFAGIVKYPILDKNFKLQKLQDLQRSMNLSPNQIMAIGDGANDLPMLQAAGIGVAYHGKPILRDALINQINYTDLASLQYLI